MKISVITVCYNSAATLGDTLASVAAQNHPDIEHIVIDGGSTDGTRALVEREGGHVKVFVSEPDKGIYDAMNKGLAHATGDVVGFLNSDDVYAHAGVLSRIAEVMADPALDACYANLYFVDPQQLDLIRRVWRSRDYEPGLCARRGWMPAHPTFYARRALYVEHGGFNLDYSLQSDFDMALRLLDIHGIRTRFVPEFWVRMRMGGASNASVRNVLRGNLEAWRAVRSHNIPVPPWFILVKLASRLSQFADRSLDIR